MNRNAAARIAEETVAIVDAGEYVIDGVRRDLRESIAAAVARTREYPPEESPPVPAAGSCASIVEVTTETTLAACRRLAAERPAALNFGSARNPGGGFRSGARAQEESLARSSALYACLRGRRMYAAHASSRDPFYSDWVIHSPDVPVIRDDAGALLADPLSVSFVTSPAVNVAAVMEHAPTRADDVARAMQVRARKVLRVFAAHGHASLVLGAWGCGVFRNDPSVVAEIFREAIAGPFRGVFGRVVFAVFDRDDGPTVGAFRTAFETPKSA